MCSLGIWRKVDQEETTPQMPVKGSGTPVAVEGAGDLITKPEQSGGVKAFQDRNIAKYSVRFMQVTAKQLKGMTLVSMQHQNTQQVRDAQG